MELHNLFWSSCDPIGNTIPDCSQTSANYNKRSYKGAHRLQALRWWAYLTASFSKYNTVYKVAIDTNVEHNLYRQAGPI
jgi:hypothetical protein